MTDSSGLKVSDLLPAGLQLEQTMKTKLCEDPGVAGTKLAWGFIGSEATNALKTVLNIDVFDVIGRCWCVAKELHEYADPSKHPAGEISIVNLGQHTFTKDLYPTLDVTIAPYKTSLRFTLKLAANIRAVALAICSGYITSIGSGDGDFSAELKYGDVSLNKKQSKKVTFPPHLDFRAPGLQLS